MENYNQNKCYKLFFRLLKEKHVLNDYLYILHKENRKCTTLYYSLNEWINDFAKKYISFNININDIPFLISTVPLFCSWVRANADVDNKYNWHFIYKFMYFQTQYLSYIQK